MSLQPLPELSLDEMVRTLLRTQHMVQDLALLTPVAAAVESWVWPATPGETCTTLFDQCEQQRDRGSTQCQCRVNCCCPANRRLLKSCSKRLLAASSSPSCSCEAYAATITAPPCSAKPCYPQPYFGSAPEFTEELACEEEATELYRAKLQLTSTTTTSSTSSSFCSLPSSTFDYQLCSPSVSSPPNAQYLDLDAMRQYDSAYIAATSPGCASIPFLDSIIESVRTEIQHEQQLTDCSSSCTSSPTSSSSSSRKRSLDDDDDDDDVDEAPVRRRPIISLASLTPAEAAARKREQNRVAALKYRLKMKQSKKGEKEEIEQLSSRNAFLRQEAARLEAEVKNLRSSLYSKFGIPLIR